MSKKINIDLEYNNRGKTLQKTVTIKKVFNWALEEWQELSKESQMVAGRLRQIHPFCPGKDR